jgi:hypothetical protein
MEEAQVDRFGLATSILENICLAFIGLVMHLLDTATSRETFGTALPANINKFLTISTRKLWWSGRLALQDNCKSTGPLPRQQIQSNDMAPPD